MESTLNDCDEDLNHVSRRFFVMAGFAGFAAAATSMAGSLVTAASAFASSTPLTLNFADLGACDGATDDSAAFSAALSELSDAGGGVVLLPPAKIALTLTALPTFEIPENVQIVGQPGATTILFSSAHPDLWLAFAGSRGNNVTFEDVMFVRNSDCTMIFFYPGGHDGFHLSNCFVDGQRERFQRYPVHGLSLEQNGPKTNISLTQCTVTGVNFGVLQSNSATSSVDTFTVDRCTFAGNFADDLEFNAPNASMTNITVTNSRFTNNLSENAAASLGVGLAHVVDAVVRGCYFENYYGEAIHLEDYCENVTITDNRIITAGTNPSTRTLTDRDRCGISVMTGSSDVLISRNYLDHTANTNSLHGIVVKNLPGDVTPGGRPNIPPIRITIADNTIRCGSTYQGMWVTNVTDTVIRGNTVIGAGNVHDGVWDGGNEGFGIKIAGGSSVIEANTVSGFRYGISGPFMSLDNDFVLPDWSARGALGNTGTVTRNVISDCYLGLVAVPAGALKISANVIFDCVRPILVGENEYSAQSSTIVSNLITGTAYPPEIDGTQRLLRAPDSSTVTVGEDKDVAVVDSFLKLPVGTAITFSGGGILTLTKAVPKSHPFIKGSPLQLFGDVTVADIGPDEYGLVAPVAR